MNDKNGINSLMAGEAEKDGCIYWAEYIRKYGYEEPLIHYDAPGGESVEKRNERAEKAAKLCIEAGKTATEMGLYEPLPKGVVI